MNLTQHMGAKRGILCAKQFKKWHANPTRWRDIRKTVDRKSVSAACDLRVMQPNVCARHAMVMV